METCPSCGTELPIIGGGAFCANCGAMVRTGSSDRSHDDTVTLPVLSSAAADVAATGPTWTVPSEVSGAGSVDPFAGFFRPGPGEPRPDGMTQIMPAVSPAAHIPGPPPPGYGQSDDYSAAYDPVPSPPWANRGAMVAVGMAVVAVAVVAVSLLTLGGGNEAPTAQTVPGRTEIVMPTSRDASAMPGNDQTPTPTGTSATPTPQRMVSLKAHADGKYVTADSAGAGPLIANRTAIDLWEQFDLLTNADGSVSLRSRANTQFVTSDSAGTKPLIAASTSIGTREKFDLVKNADGSVSFRARADGKYVTADSAGASPLIANRTAIGPWEEFDLLG